MISSGITAGSQLPAWAKLKFLFERKYDTVPLFGAFQIPVQSLRVDGSIMGLRIFITYWKV
jgi:hypothetical protein